MKRAFIIVVLLMSPHPVFAEDAQVFTNESLSKYENTSPGITEEPEQTQPAPKAKIEQRRKADSESDFRREYYCTQATKLKRDIENAKDELKAAENSTVRWKYTEKSYPNKTHTETGNDLVAVMNARKKIEYLEKSQADFEENARRQNIPPGWLRCQW